MKISLYGYQEDMVGRLGSIYGTQNLRKRAFLQMPTGTGKTRTAIAFAQRHLESAKNRNVVWVAHQTNLVKQAKQDLLNLIGDVSEITDRNLTDPLEVDGVTWHFQTWQGLREQPTEHLKTFQMIITDEVHCGGSESNTEKKSFNTILKKGVIKDHLYVSATPWDLDSELFEGLTEEHLAVYSWQDAINNGSISDVIFCKYDSALTLEIEDRTSGMEADPVDASSMEELVGSVQEIGIDVCDEVSLSVLHKAKARCLFDAFFQEEVKNKVIPPTLVFCRSVDQPDDPLSIMSLKKMFLEMCAKRLKGVSGSNIADSCYGERSGKECSDVLKGFKAGTPRVLFVVQMANEGFDYRELECVIDFRMNAVNAKRTVQKIGRLLRVSAGKPAARYYYCDSIENHLKIDGVKKEIRPEFMEKIRTNTHELIKRPLTEEESRSVAGNVGFAIALDINAGLVKGGGFMMPHPVLGVSAITHDAGTTKMLQGLGVAGKGTLSKVGFVVKAAYNPSTEAKKWTMHECFINRPDLSEALQKAAIEWAEMARDGFDKATIISKLEAKYPELCV